MGLTKGHILHAEAPVEGYAIQAMGPVTGETSCCGPQDGRDTSRSGSLKVHEVSAVIENTA